MMIRPQRKQQQKRQEMMNQLNVGDEVVTIGRLHGVVDSIDNEAKTVTLDCDGIYLVFDRMAIMRVEKKQTLPQHQQLSQLMQIQLTQLMMKNLIQLRKKSSFLKARSAR